MATHKEIINKLLTHSMNIRALPTIEPVLKHIDQGNDSKYIPNFQSFLDSVLIARFGEGGEPE